MWMDSWVLARPPQLWPKVTLSDGSRQSLLFRVFESQRPCVVLAKSNTAESEVDTEACLRDGVPILRRRGGGGTVVLGPGCQIVTVAFFARSLFDNARLFAAINGAWMQALSDSLGPVCPPLMQRGISDLATVHTPSQGCGHEPFSA
jgi:lipoate-protein ligase A